MAEWLIVLLLFAIFSGGAIAGVILFIYLINLSRQVKNLAGRVGAVETGLTAAPPSERPTEPRKMPTETAASASPPPPRPTPLEMKKPEWNIEALIGGRVLNRVGVVALVLGVGYFIKLAFDNQWVGELGRVAIGFLVGLILLVLGEWYRRKDYPYFSQGLTGGSIAIFYLSIYAAFGFYHLIEQGPAFLFMIFVTAAAVILAVWNRALPIAMLATLGGFMTPFILSTGVDNQAGLFSYIFLLNAGILATAYFRNWRALNYQSFILTVITFAAWAERFYKPEKLGPTAFFLTIFFVLFALLAIMYNIVNRRKASAPELILAFANAALYFGAMYFLLDKKYGDYLGLFSLAVAATYIAQAYLTNIRHSEDRFLTWIFLGLGATFVTLAVPIQLKQNWITVGWAVEGALLAYIAWRYDSRNTRLAAFAILCLVFFRLIFFDVSLPRQVVKEEFVLLLNKRVFSYVVGIAAMAFTAYLFSRNKDKSPYDMRVMAGSLLVAANLLAIVLLSIEAHDFFRHLRSQDAIQRSVYRYAPQLSLSIIWGVYAAALLIGGIWRKHKPLRYMALVLFAITIAKVFLIDLSELERAYRVVSLIALSIILIAVSGLYQKYKDVLLGPEPEEGRSE
jgi:uncharacterized membrane protein